MHGAAALSFAWMLGDHASALAGEPGRRIQRSETPLTLETPIAALEQPLTPNELFYVRNHFPVPTLQANTWRLRVQGAVERELDLTLEDLRRMTARTVTMTLECAGNSRSLLNPAVRGTQWANGAVSTTEWTGVSLIDVLNRAGIRQGAVDVVLEGADRGEIVSEPRTPGAIQYGRSLPLAKARQQTVILAHRMRNADLPANHGFPVRAIVPGWYGMASVKWLTRIIVTDRPYNGFFQSLDYSIYERRQGSVTVTPITEMQVKSLIVSPTPMQRIAPNTAVRVHGVAWSGDANVTRVEISSDNGRTWAAARLLGNELAHTWRPWELNWRTPAAAANVRLLARATDARGNTQPMQRDTDRRNYMVNHVVPVEVDVR
jgi:DMSO/TMAO reductase YedYZ molybdopterin-dependent catalytic subunit